MIFPSNDYVERMIAARMIQRWTGRIPNAANIDPAFADPPFDPGRAYSMPYFWARSASATAGPRRAHQLGRHVRLDKHARRISLLDSIVSIQSALKYLSHSLNTDDPAKIDEAARC